MRKTSFYHLIPLAICSVITACFSPTLKGRPLTSHSSSSSLVFTPASGPVGTLITLTGIDFSNITSVSIGNVAAVILSSSSTSAKILVMPGSSYNRISVVTTTESSTSSDYFTVTTTGFPATQQGLKLVGTGNTGNAQQGYSVALSADGNTAIIGGYTDNAFQGAAWIWERTGTTWSQEAGPLIGSGNVGAAWQGWSVAISGDGNTALVGGNNDNGFVGATWVWVRTGTTWSQQGSKLVGTGYTGTPQQGNGVALSSDGNTAVIGGPVNNANNGAIWIFTRSGTIWSQQAGPLVGTGNVGAAGQGFSVALSGDGNTALTSGYNDNGSIGAAWVFTRTAGVWTQQGLKLVGTGNAGNSGQGFSIALSGDGNTAIIGGYTDNANNGAAWVFTRTAGVWTQQGLKLVGTGNVGNAYQGYGVSLTSDGNTAVISGFADNGNNGATWVWTRNAGVWTQQGTKLVGTGNIGAARQGNSVSISADGSTTLVGANSDNGNIGAAWVFIP